MKRITLLLLFISLQLFAQKEANNWYFGRRAGIKFNDDGSTSVLNGSLMDTNEGCSTISDANGNLLFYTDGRTIWDRNHVTMPNASYANGTGLMGDASSTLSGIIVPKKNNPNIYYVFTVDEPHHQNAAVYPNQFTGDYEGASGGGSILTGVDDGYNNGLNYSVVDLSVTGNNGSIGNVTTANTHLLTYNPSVFDEAKYKCSEKITAVKNHDGSGFWVIAHFLDKFYAFLVDENGVNATPVVTQITPLVPTEGYRRNAIGCFKASPDGNYLAIAHQQLGMVEGASDTNGCVYLYNFDNQTGVVSNPVLVRNNVNPYGVEFSAQTKKLYICSEVNDNASIHQYNLLAANIASSGINIGNTPGSTALQLGPNGKIYSSDLDSSSLSVINNPEEDGLLCNFLPGGMQLPSNMKSIFGLPPFITSLFSATISFKNTCLGDNTTFELAANNTIDSVSWNFGDGTATSSATAPSHVFAAAGTYNVAATITQNGETETVTRDVTIHQMPVANTPQDITICDPDNDGFTSFNLSANNAAILGTQSSTQFSIRYFASQADADANITSLNATSYTNTSNPQTIWARVQNNSSAVCYDVVTFELLVSQSPVLGNSSLSICDDDTDGDDTNGKATFNLTAFTDEFVVNLGFTTTYYATQADAEVPQSALPQSYYNATANTQTIYARIVNNTYNNCITIEPVTLTVNPLPASVQNAVLIQCDTGFNPDGFTPFNLTEANNQYTNGNADFSITYYNNDTAAQAETGVITGAFTNTSNPQTISARVTNTLTGCYRILPLQLHVTTNTFDAVEMERCDDDDTEDGLAAFDLTSAGFETSSTTTVYYAALEDALMEQNAIAQPAAYTNTTPAQQSVYARIEENNACMAIREIVLYVRPLPPITAQETAIVCLNTLDYIQLSAGITANAQNYTYLWSTGQTTRFISVNQPGTYTVEVTDTTHPVLCSKVRTYNVLPSNIAHVDNIEVQDLTENNTITVYASPVGGVNTSYTYSLNAPNGPWQESPYFENVAPGIHTLYINDVNGCGIVKEQVAVLAIPRYFSPNNDGINDYWHITGINGIDYNNSKIYIFDRYGKLLSDVKATGPGWDGTYNGVVMPSTDYWYMVQLEDGRTVKGHFSMVR